MGWLDGQGVPVLKPFSTAGTPITIDGAEESVETWYRNVSRSRRGVAGWGGIGEDTCGAACAMSHHHDDHLSVRVIGLIAPKIPLLPLHSSLFVR